MLHFTLDTYLILLSVKQGGIKYYFLSFWHDSPEMIIIYFTKYDFFFWSTLDTNQTNKKKHGKFLNFSFIKMTNFGSAIISSQILCILFLKGWRQTKDISAQLSCKSHQRWAALMGSLALTFRSSSFHTSFMGFKSADYAGQDITWRTCCFFLLLIFLWQSLRICFESLFCIISNPWPAI